MSKVALPSLPALLSSGCSSEPPPPPWQVSGERPRPVPAPVWVLGLLSGPGLLSALLSLHFLLLGLSRVNSQHPLP